MPGIVFYPSFMVRRIFIWILLALPTIIFVGLGVWMGGWIAFLTCLEVYFLLLVPFVVIPGSLKLAWGVILGRAPSGWLTLVRRSFVAYQITALAMMVFVGGFLVYNNEYAPATLPVVTLTNGEKTVTFRAMAHVASPGFYQDVQRDIALARASGAVVFYEGVRPGSVANTARLQKILGVQLSAEWYEQLAQLAGLTDQLSFPLSTMGTGVLNVDISVDDVVAAYDRAAGTGALVYSGSQIVSPKIDQAIALIKNLSPQSRQGIAYVVRAFLNFMIRHESDLQIAIRETDPALAIAIIDTRDHFIAEALLSSKQSQIYATYGLMHFQGIYNVLRSGDPRWNIQEVRFETPIR